MKDKCYREVLIRLAKDLPLWEIDNECGWVQVSYYEPWERGLRERFNQFWYENQGEIDVNEFISIEFDNFNDI